MATGTSESPLHGSSFAGLMTPAFVVDRAIVQRNCDRMREKAARSNVMFRPHVKTHKTIEIGRMQHGGEAGPITVSTLAEADFYAANGFRDITYAVPLAPEKVERVAGLVSRVERLNVLIDSEAALHSLESFNRASGTVFDVFLKLDCGYHRAGVDPEAASSVELALAIHHSAAARYRGVLVHAGHSYHARNAAEIRSIAAEETACVSAFAAKLPGIDTIRSIGSTPTTSVVEMFTGCDEVRPGNYVFFDAFQVTIGSCDISDVAVSVLATVIGSYPDRGSLVVDAGALGMSKDSGPDHMEPQFGYGIVCDTGLNPRPLKLVALSQEHGKIVGDPREIGTLAVGAQLRIIPNHSCLTAAMYDCYHVLEAGRIVGEWKPVRGW